MHRRISDYEILNNLFVNEAYPDREAAGCSPPLGQTRGGRPLNPAFHNVITASDAERRDRCGILALTSGSASGLASNLG